MREKFYQSPLINIGVICVLAAAVGVILWIAPAEKTLGSNIKPVYLHVALIWAGMLLLYIAGGLGLWITLFPESRLLLWMKRVGLVSFAFLAASMLVSFVAQKMAWGGIAWNEPRMAAMLKILAFAVVVQVVNSWAVSPRLQGVLNVLLAGVVYWLIAASPLQLHPRDPIGTSSSTAIRFTFFGLFVLCGLAAMWLVFYPRRENQ